MRALPLLLLAVACTRQTQSDKVVSNKPAVALTPPAAPPSASALLAWPIAPFTKAQIAEVKKCDLEKRADRVYAKSVDIDALPTAAKLVDICDQATLAQACATRLKDDQDPTKPCIAAYSAAVKSNPAFAFAAGLPGGYFGKVAIVDPPSPAAHVLTSAVIHYSWGGMGDAVDWTLTIKDANTKPSVTVTGATSKPAPADIGTKIAALGSALQSFLPIPEPLEATSCYDNYPDWTATLTFEGGGTLELATHRSNLLGLGGPWQLTVGSQTYVQLGPQLVKAMAALMKALDLPAGEPMAQTCHGYDIEAAVLK
jgi:hypothetical protein